MMRRTCLAILGLVTLACAAGERPQPAGAGLSLDAEAAARAIREDTRFQEPIRVEIWSHVSGFTTEALEKAGYLRREQRGKGKFALTDKGREAGAAESFFQSDIPIFYFPVATREIKEVRPSGENQAGAFRMMEFTYFAAPNEIGIDLLRGGSTLKELDRERLRTGSALVAWNDGTWRVERIHL